MTNLTRPEGDKRTEGETGVGSGAAHLSEGSACRDGEGTGKTGLDLDLGHLQRAEGNVGEELSRGRTSKPDSTLVLGGGFLTSKVHVGILEEFVETVLEHALEGVADECGTEAFPETTATLLGGDGLETRDEAVELARVHLR